MAAKVILEAARATPGYAGIAIFIGDEPLHVERIEYGYALRLRALYHRLCEANLPTGEYLCAMAAGFTFYVFREGGIEVLLRLNGRFSSLPRLSGAEPEYAEPLAEAVLPSRAGVRHEAEALLRQYDLLK